MKSITDLFEYQSWLYATLEFSICIIILLTEAVLIALPLLIICHGYYIIKWLATPPVEDEETGNIDIFNSVWL